MLLIRTIVIVAVMCLGVGRAEAVPIIQTLPGNDCSNPNCVADETGTFVAEEDDERTPFIIKFNSDGTVDEINTALFPSITGEEFDFDPELDGDLTSGTWFYDPGEGDPLIRFWTAKGGPNYNFFYDDGGVDGGPAVPVDQGDWLTPTNPNNGQGFGLSHLAFYDTGDIPDVPEPALLLMFGTAVAAAAYRGRRRG